MNGEDDDLVLCSLVKENKNKKVRLMEDVKMPM